MERLYTKEHGSEGALVVDALDYTARLTVRWPETWTPADSLFVDLTPLEAMELGAALSGWALGRMGIAPEKMLRLMHEATEGDDTLDGMRKAGASLREIVKRNTQ